jgi:hypothetical protein
MNEGKFALWQKWLLIVGAIIAVFGVMLALFGGTALFSIMNQQVSPVFWGAIDTPANAKDFQQWIYGVLGATMAGWGIFTIFIAHYPFKRKEQWAWTCLASGVLVWFVIDTTISLNFKVYFNAAFNTALLIAVMLPLAFSRKHF